MPILSDSSSTTGDLSLTLGAWAINFIVTLVGLFISLYLLISHDDLQSNFIEPAELSNNLRQVSEYKNFNLWSNPIYLKFFINNILNFIVYAFRLWMHTDFWYYFSFYCTMVHNIIFNTIDNTQCESFPKKRSQIVLYCEEWI